MKNTLSIFLVAFLMPTCAVAQTEAFTVVQTGAAFIDVPPGGDKNLAPFNTFGKAKVEAHAVISLKDQRQFARMTFASSVSKVQAAASLNDKTSVDLGPAEVSNWLNYSDDHKKVSVTVSVTKLPEKAVAGVIFTGTVRLDVASGTTHKMVSFDPKPGTRLELGLGVTTISEIGVNKITLSGGDSMGAIENIKLIKPDGSALTAKRTGSMKFGSSQTIQWEFSGPLATGKLDVTLYQHLQSVDVPIKLIVVKPY